VGNGDNKHFVVEELINNDDRETVQPRSSDVVSVFAFHQGELQRMSHNSLECLDK